MKRLKLTVFALIAVLAGAALALPAHAHGPRTRAHIGLHFGIPLGWPYWGYPYPPYYAPYPSQVIVVPREPTTYIEQPRVETTPEATGYWYYCAGAGAYYPHVKECPAGWQRVAPRPSGE